MSHDTEPDHQECAECGCVFSRYWSAGRCPVCALRADLQPDKGERCPDAQPNDPGKCYCDGPGCVADKGERACGCRDGCSVCGTADALGLPTDKGERCGTCGGTGLVSDRGGFDQLGSGRAVPCPGCPDCRTLKLEDCCVECGGSKTVRRTTVGGPGMIGYKVWYEDCPKCVPSSWEDLL